MTTEGGPRSGQSYVAPGAGQSVWRLELDVSSERPEISVGSSSNPEVGRCVCAALDAGTSVVSVRIQIFNRYKLVAVPEKRAVFSSFEAPAAKRLNAFQITGYVQLSESAGKLLSNMHRLAPNDSMQV
jgi:hypothetical protein